MNDHEIAEVRRLIKQNAYLKLQLQAIYWLDYRGTPHVCHDIAGRALGYLDNPPPLAKACECCGVLAIADDTHGHLCEICRDPEHHHGVTGA